MAKVNVRVKSGKAKKVSDYLRNRNFHERHTENIGKPVNTIPSRIDDPLGNSNARILLAMQNRR